MEAVFDPFLADLQADWLEARAQRGASYAKWRLLSGYASLLAQVATCALGSLFGPTYALAPALDSAAMDLEGESFSGRLTRHMAALGSAFLITFGLFAMMSSLIARTQGESKAPPDISIGIVPIEKTPETVEPVKPELPRRPEPQPEGPSVRYPTDPTNEAIARHPVRPGEGWKIPMDFETGGVEPVPRAANQGLVPRVRVAPEYPQRALVRGLEGWVEVEFTVTEIGSVSDPVVVESHPRSIFDRVSLRAVEQWKYEPMIIDGKPVSSPGVRTRLVFELDRE